MQTVNFQCGHCGRLMAVGTEFLGQQVRCPHCQQVVIAPASQSPASAPQPESAPFSHLGHLGDHEDIFQNKSETDDPLFGQEEGPRLELSRETPPRSGAHTNGVETPLPDAGEPAARSDHAHTPGSLFVNEQPGEASASVGAESSPLPVESPSVARARRGASGGGSVRGMAFMLIVYLPTLLWALGASGMCFWLYSQLSKVNSRTSPFDLMPDDGDDRGVKGTKTRKVGRLNIDREFATAPLPSHLIVKLGETVRVGDLEVTPTKVSRRRVGVHAGPGRAEPCTNDSLVLSLRLKSLATDYAFAPLDNYFDRQSRGIGQVPLTLVQAGPQAFFGGPAKWVPLLRDQEKRENRQWLEGRKNVDLAGLQPGEDVETYVCTDGEDAKAVDYLFGSRAYRGELMWRVHVRRGAYEHRGKRVTATAVVGVKFSDQDYKR